MCQAWRVALVITIVASYAACGGTDGGTTMIPSTAGKICLPDTAYERTIGGEVSDGPFDFNVALYSDREIKARDEADHPSRASDVPGVGWRATWVYHGPDTGPIGEIWGDKALLQGERPPPNRDKISEGEHGGRDGGGIVLDATPKAGHTYTLGIKVTTTSTQHGALISFTLEEQDGVLRACNITLSKLTNG